MPTFVDVSKAIENRILDNWTTTPVAFQNVPARNLGLPTKDQLAKGSVPYVSTRILFGTTINMEIGPSPIKRTFGSLVMDFYSKKDTGTNTNLANIDDLAALFEYQKISGIVFRNLTVMQSNAMDSWYVTPTMIMFQFDR